MKVSQLVSALQRDPQQNQGMANAQTATDAYRNWATGKPMAPVNRPQPTRQPMPRPMEQSQQEAGWRAAAPMRPAPRPQPNLAPRVPPAFPTQSSTMAPVGGMGPNQFMPAIYGNSGQQMPPMPLDSMRTLPYNIPQNGMGQVPSMDIETMNKLAAGQPLGMVPPAGGMNTKQYGGGYGLMFEQPQPGQPIPQPVPNYQPMIRRF